MEVLKSEKNYELDNKSVGKRYFYGFNHYTV